MSLLSRKWIVRCFKLPNSSKVFIYFYGRVDNVDVNVEIKNWSLCNSNKQQMIHWTSKTGKQICNKNILQIILKFAKNWMNANKKIFQFSKQRITQKVINVLNTATDPRNLRILLRIKFIFFRKIQGCWVNACKEKSTVPTYVTEYWTAGLTTLTNWTAQTASDVKIELCSVFQIRMSAMVAWTANMVKMRM